MRNPKNQLATGNPESMQNFLNFSLKFRAARPGFKDFQEKNFPLGLEAPRACASQTSQSEKRDGPKKLSQYSDLNRSCSFWLRARRTDARRARKLRTACSDAWLGKSSLVRQFITLMRNSHRFASSNGEMRIFSSTVKERDAFSCL